MTRPPWPNKSHNAIQRTATALMCLIGSATFVAAQEPTLAELRVAWKPGSTWTNTSGTNSKPDTDWRVDSFDRDRLTISKRSTQGKGRVVVTLQAKTKLELRVLEANHAGTPKAMSSRKHCGGGWIDRDGLFFELHAELRPAKAKGEWEPWDMKIRLKPGARDEVDGEPAGNSFVALPAGARLSGRRTDGNRERGKNPVTMEGEVIRHDARMLVVRCRELMFNGRFSATWDWRFERDGHDADGQPVWNVMSGIAQHGEPTNQRFNWRGRVVWQNGRLEGSYWFDWRGMEDHGLKPGSQEHSHPLVLELMDSKRQGKDSTVRTPRNP